MSTTAVYPGTFDPLTMGHLDLLQRTAQLFDAVTVAVAGNSLKPGGMFDINMRMQMIVESIAETGLKNVRVDRLDSLLVDYCREHKINVIVRGVRVYSDFEYEFQMALTNRKLAPEVETLFMMPNENYSYVTASTVREIARYGGETSAFVPPAVQRQIARHISLSDRQKTKQGDSLGNSGSFDR